MVRVTSNDAVIVEFPKEMADQIPYMKDIIENMDDDHELPAVFATSAQLKVLKRILVAQPSPSSSFLPRFSQFALGDRVVKAPPFLYMAWEDICFDAIFKSLSEDDIVDLILVADAMCMWELRKGAMYLLFYKRLHNGFLFPQFFEKASMRLQNILAKCYLAALTNEQNNGYCDLPDNRYLW